MIADHEWDTLALLIDEAWPGEFDDSAAKAWRLLLDDFDAEQVLTSLKLLISRGGTFRPSVAEVVAEIRRDPSKPTWSEVFTLVFGRGGVLKAQTTVYKSWWEPGERQKLDDNAAWERADRLHPLIGAFIRAQGLTRLRGIAMDDPNYGDLNRKKLAEEWERFVDANEHREVAALVSGRRGEMARLDPLAALGMKPQAAITIGEDD